MNLLESLPYEEPEEEVEETSTEESTELEDIPTDTNDDGQITLSLD